MKKKKEKKLFVVVHVEDKEQACRNAMIAARAGADGVFLIGHRMGALRLREIYGEVRKFLPDLWIGINFLLLDPKEAMAILPAKTHGLWVDDIGIDEDRNVPVLAAQSHWHVWLERKKEEKDWNSLYFAGVAFKHQKQPRDLSYVLREAVKYCDVITTSGDETGSPPSLEKIQSIREAIGDFPLAIASGITPENVGEFLPYTDYFLVSTGISKSFDELDPCRVMKLVQTIGLY